MKPLLLLLLLTACVAEVDDYTMARTVPVIHNVTIKELNASFINETTENENNISYVNETVDQTEDNETEIVTVNETVNETNVNVTEVMIGSQVIFWLGTPFGAFKDLLSEGETHVYEVYGNVYEVTVVFIGEGEDGLGEALFQVNGRLSKPLREKQSDRMSDGEYIFVREVHYRRTPTSFKIR